MIFFDFFFDFFLIFFDFFFCFVFFGRRGGGDVIC